MPGLESLDGFLRTIGELHRRMHVLRTLHALPFAAVGALWARNGRAPSATEGWLLAFVVIFGRGLAVSLARLFRSPADVANPESPGEAGTAAKVPVAVWAAFAVHAAALFIFLSYQLNVLSGHLSFAACALFTVHAATRRFTGLSHFMLGLGLGLVPIGAWVALRGEIDTDAAPAAVLAGGIVMWAAGFDMIYSLAAPVGDGEGLPRPFRRPASLSPARILFLAESCQVTATALFLRAMILVVDPRWALAATGGIALTLLLARFSMGPGSRLSLGPRFFSFQLLVGPILLAATLAGL